MQLLIDRRAKINSLDEDDNTPLHLAAKKGAIEVVQVLLDHNAKINIQNDSGRTPLHYAAKKGDVYIVLLLLERDADVNAKDSSDTTALHLAVQNNRDDVIRILIDYGADMNAEDDAGYTPLDDAACRSSSASVIKLLLKEQLTTRRLSRYKIESLKDMCVFKLLDNRIYDDKSIIDTAIPLLSELNIPFDKRNLNINLYKEMLLRQAISTTQNDFIQSDVINAYCKRYLKQIKTKIVNANLFQRLLTSKNQDILILCQAIANAHSFDELPEDMQDIIYAPDILKL